MAALKPPPRLPTIVLLNREVVVWGKYTGHGVRRVIL